MNLAVQFATDTTTITKARNVCKTIKYSGSLQQKLHSKCIELSVTPRKIALDVETRWNSLYRMVEILIHLRLPISQLLNDHVRYDESINLTTSDWESLERLVNA